MALLIFYLGIALTISFLCSLLESILLSSTLSYLHALHGKQKNYAKRWIYLKESIDKPLSAILSLNTIANTIGAVGVGSQVTLLFGSGYLGIASGLMTILILLFSEIIPKTLGARYWKNLLPYFGEILHFLVLLLSPFVWISQFIALRISVSQKSPSTYRDELHALAKLAKNEGAFSESDYRILRNVIFLHQITAENIMTPRTVVVAVPDTMTLIEIFQSKEPKRFSRVPIYETTIDNIIGFYLKSDLLTGIIQGKGDSSVREIARNINITHELTPVPLLFEELLSKREHISLVVDSYGGMSGIVTMEGIIETIFGIEIMDELDSNRDIQSYAKG